MRNRALSIASDTLFARALERTLGDPRDPSITISYSRIVSLDEAETFPLEFVARLHETSLFLHLIPAELGGALRSFDESLLLLRLVARRDLTIAIAFGQTFLGAIPVWLAGADAQRQALAIRIRAGELGCLALTEEAHGGDLLACDLAATPAGAGYTLSGRKWLINNATRGGTVSVYARTAAGNAPSAFTLFLLEKSALTEPARYQPIAKVRTHGIRGADISGFVCDALPVPAAAGIGAPGKGYEITLKTLQVSRTMCAALSLGAGDTALRTALQFAVSRRIFNDTVINMPSARDQLVSAYADLLLCECVSVASARALQASPDRMAVWSSIVKYLVPTIVGESIAAAAVVLGARHYLREGHVDGIFQKCLRDNAVVGLFDGSTAVNLHIISGQLPALARRRASGAAFDRDRLRPLFDPRHTRVSRFPSLAEVKFTNNGEDEIVAALATLADEPLPDGCAPLVQRLAAESAALDTRITSLQERDPSSNTPERAELARRYCLIHAGAACVLTWRHARGGGDPFFDEGAWLTLCLRQVLRRLVPDAGAIPPASANAVFERMRDQLDRDELLSLIPLPLG